MTRLLYCGCATAMVVWAGCMSEPVDTRSPLTECAHGLYWADCGGTDAPVLGCDRETGDCRWFGGGETARGYAVSDCPTTDPCCHDRWPFTDFVPSGEVYGRTRDLLSLLGQGVVTRQGVSNVSIVPDLAEPIPLPRIRCAAGFARFPGCDSSGAGGYVERIGRSVVVTFGFGTFRVELEIIPTESLEGWSVNAYSFYSTLADGPPVLWCQNYSAGTELAVEGILHLNSTDTSDPTNLHGRLEGVSSDGVQFTMEF